MMDNFDMAAEKRKVLITGAGCICNAGPDVPSCTAALYSGDFPRPAPPDDFMPGFEQDFPVFACKKYLHAHYRDEKNVFISSSFALQAALEALRNAGVDPGELSRSRTGICMGTTVGASLNILDFYKAWKEGGHPDLEQIYRYMRSNPALFLQEKFGLSGPVQTTTNACSSGTDAIGIGMQWIRQGICDRVIAGGTDELNELAYNGFIRLMNCSNEPCRPFDKERKGLNLGEGAGILILESEKSAEKRGAGILGEVAGYSSAADAHHLTAPHPEARGLEIAFSRALKQAGIGPKDIGVINVHGTGTRANDQAEASLLSRFPEQVPFFGSKGMTGHTLGAAGGMEAIFTLYCLREKRIPFTAGFSTPDPELGVAPAKGETELSSPWAVSQSLAFGGNNSVLVLKGEEQPCT
ncbi:MAG: beta-ketoacyl-[acyl-carrier-protein] synthase family protein [Desulfonatronovibrionaceae bacterium]